MSQVENDEIRAAVREAYSQIALGDGDGCCSSAPSCCASESSSSPVPVGSLQLGYS